MAAHAWCAAQTGTADLCSLGSNAGCEAGTSLHGSRIGVHPHTPKHTGWPGVIGNTLGFAVAGSTYVIPCPVTLLLWYFWLPALDQNTKDLQNFLGAIV